jgi:hypothetical protein
MNSRQLTFQKNCKTSILDTDRNLGIHVGTDVRMPNREGRTNFR